MLLAGPMLLQMVLTILHIGTEAQSSIERLNYGVVFQSEREVSASKNYWLHTIQIPLPHHVRPHETDYNECKTAVSCNILKNAHNVSMAIRQATYTKMMAMLHDIKAILPKKEDISRNNRRGTRSLLPFVSSISKYLFGTATNEDLQKLAKHIQILSDRQGKLATTLEHQASELASFMSSTDKRITNALSAVQLNHKDIAKLASNVMIIRKEVQMASTVNSHLTKLAHASNQLIEGFSALSNACQQLLSGSISQTLIPVEKMQTILTHLESIIQDKFPQFGLVHKNVRYYYSQSDFMYAYHHHAIYITIKFPIRSHVSALHIYKIDSFPVPVNKSSTDGTLLSDLPEYLAISNDNAFYAEMSENQFRRCLSRESYCSKVVTLKPISQKSCALSIFNQNKKNIKSHCSFKFSTNIIQPAIHSLSDNRYLITNVSNFVQKCPETEPTTISECHYCIFKLNCTCSLSSPHFFIPQTLQNCQTTEEKSKILFPINLALIQHFFDDNKHEEIQANTLFKKYPNINTPKFDFFQHSLSDIIASDKKEHFNLQKMVSRTKSEKKIFHSIAEPILESYAISDDNFWSTQNIVIIASSSVATIAMALAIYLAIKLYRLNAIVIGLSQIKGTHAFSLSYGKSEDETTTIQSESVICQGDGLNGFAVSVLCIICLISFGLVIFILYQNIMSKCRSTIYLRVTRKQIQDSKCVMIPIVTLPRRSPIFHCEMKGEIDVIVKLNTCLTATLDLGFSKLILSNNLSSTLEVTNIVQISFWHYFQMKELLKTGSSNLTFDWILSHQDIGIYIDMCKECSCLDVMP